MSSIINKILQMQSVLSLTRVLQCVPCFNCFWPLLIQSGIVFQSVSPTMNDGNYDGKLIALTGPNFTHSVTK